MPLFSYTAKNQSLQKPVKGTVVAESARHAREQLREQGMLIQSLTESTDPGNGLFVFQRRANPTVVSGVIRELATLTHAGIPISEAIGTLVRQHSGATRTWLMQLRDRVEQGVSLADAMAEQPGVFNSLAVSMVKVGENAGNLEEVLAILADFAEKSLSFKNRLFSALLYPALVLIASIGVSVFLMTSVVPMLLVSLVEAGQTLPLPTQILKSASDLLVEYGGWLVGLLLVCSVIMVSYLKSERGRRAWHRVQLKIPLIGSLAFRQTMSRTAFIIATLLRSGLELTKAMSIAADTCQNSTIADSLKDVEQAITSGSDLGPAFEASSVFPPVLVQIFAVGQQSGQLESMLERLSIDYEHQVETLSSRLATILEPVTIIFLTAIVGFILMATILPILEAGNAM